MSLHIRTFIIGLFALLTTFLLAFTPVGTKPAPASGGNAWLSFGLNTLADAAISGEIDLENIAKDAAFTYVSGGIQNSSADFGSQQWLTVTAVRAAKEGTLQTVIYGGSLKDNILNSATQIVVNDATALAQGQIHDIKAENFWGEGSVPGALLHGGVGGLASLAKDGDFAAGFVAAAGAEFTTGFVHKQTGGDQTRTGEIIRKYTNPTLAALTSGGDVGQYSINQSISDSQLKNNYLKHAERDSFLKELSECKGNRTCISTVAEEYTKLSDKNNAKLIDAIKAGDLDRIAKIRSQIPTDMLEYQATVFAYLKDDPAAARKFADVLNEGAVINLNGNPVTAGEATFYALRDGYYDKQNVGNMVALGVSEFGPMGLTPNLVGLLGARGPVGAGKLSMVPENLSSYMFKFKLPERILHVSGIRIPKNQIQMIKEFDATGYPTKAVISPTSGKIVGTQYTLPDGSRVRAMQADGRNPKRASFENANGQPIDPTTGKPPQPPSGLTRAERKQYVREKTHIIQND